MSEVKPLYELLQLELGKKNIEKTALPNCIAGNLNPAFPMRPYQQKAFQFFLNYWQECGVFCAAVLRAAPTKFKWRISKLISSSSERRELESRSI